MTKLKTPQVVQDLERAAQILEKDGWTGTGAYYIGDPRTGPCCAVGAVRRAVYGRSDTFLTPTSKERRYRAALEALRIASAQQNVGSITVWNDRQRDKRVITRALRRAARKFS